MMMQAMMQMANHRSDEADGLRIQFPPSRKRCLSALLDSTRESAPLQPHKRARSVTDWDSQTTTDEGSQETQGDGSIGILTAAPRVAESQVIEPPAASRSQLALGDIEAHPEGIPTTGNTAAPPQLLALPPAANGPATQQLPTRGSALLDALMQRDHERAKALKDKKKDL